MESRPQVTSPSARTNHYSQVRNPRLKKAKHQKVRLPRQPPWNRKRPPIQLIYPPQFSCLRQWFWQLSALVCIFVHCGRLCTFTSFWRIFRVLSGSAFDLAGGSPSLGFGTSAAIAGVSIPLCLFLFYASILKATAETEADDEEYMKGRYWEIISWLCFGRNRSRGSKVNPALGDESIWPHITISSFWIVVKVFFFQKVTLS